MDMNNEDLKYIDECLSGNQKAFERILNKYEKLVFRIALRMTNNCVNAEEITRTVFIKVFNELNSFDRKNEFVDWLYDIAVNEAVNYCEKQGKLVPGKL
jgi:RNA polymerase sigma factor (sigma-70 family)